MVSWTVYFSVDTLVRGASSQEQRQAFDIHVYGQSVLSRVASVLTPEQRVKATTAVKGAEAQVNQYYCYYVFTCEGDRPSPFTLYTGITLFFFSMLGGSM